MKLRYFVLAAAVFLLLAGCGEKKKSRCEVAAGLPPVADIAGRLLSGEDMPVSSALPEGRSPHDYSPSPGAMKLLSGSKVLFTTGMPFENTVAKALQGTGVKIVDVTGGVKRIPLEEHCTHEHHHEHSADEFDPHVWLSPENCRIIAGNMAGELEKIYPERKERIRANLAKLDSELDTIAKDMKKRLAPYKGRAFFVHHPAFGYFAHASGLKQRFIELGGREISPAHMAGVIKEARENKVKTIFVQPQFNPAAAQTLARSIDGEAVPLDPLGADVTGNFHRITDSIIRGFEHK